MTILHLISSGGLYGAEAVILNLSRVLNATGEHRSILGIFDNGPGSPRQLQPAAQAMGVEVHELPCRGQVDLQVPARLRALVEKTGADVIHAHGYKADVYAALALRVRVRRPLVSTCHTWYDNDLAVRLYGALDRLALRGFAGVVAVSEEVRARLLQSGVKPGRIRIIRNGVDGRPFALAARQRAARGIGTLRVGLVGRLAPEKGIDLFLRAIAQWRAARPALTPSVEFVIVGDGPDRPELEALRDELGLQSHVRFEGHCSDMLRFYTSLDLLVSASRQEGLPVALLEGMASGLPLVATAVGEVPQLAGENGTVLLVPPNDPAALGATMTRLIDDPELREHMGTAAQQRIAHEFSAEAMAAQYMELYRSVQDAFGPQYAPSRHAAQVR